MSIQDIVNINITRESKSVSRAGFGTALYLSAAAMFAEVFRAYSSLKALGVDFATNTDVYKAGLAHFGQEVKPKLFLVGKRTTKALQVVTITPTAVNDFSYSVTVDGQEYVFLSDASATVAEIVTGLIAVINGDAEATVVASGTTTLILTAKVSGTGFAYTVEANLAAVLTTPNNGVVEDILAVKAATEDFYKIILASRNSDDQLAAAAYVETQKNILALCSDDAGIKSAGTTDVASKLKARGYVRTYFFFSADQANYPEAGIEGLMGPKDPGSYTYGLKSIKGIAADNLTDTEIVNLKAKNVNFYVVRGGVPVFMPGIVIGEKEWIDTIIFIDWLDARMGERIFSTLIGADKIPYTDKGIDVIDNDIKAQLKEGVRVGGLSDNPAPTTSVPKASEVDPADKLARVLRNVTFNGTLAGAIQELEINGSVSV